MMMFRFCRLSLGLVAEVPWTEHIRHSSDFAWSLVGRSWSLVRVVMSMCCHGWICKLFGWFVVRVSQTVVVVSAVSRGKGGRNVGTPSATCQRCLVTRRSSCSLSACHSRCAVPVLGRSIWRWSVCGSPFRGLRLVSRGRIGFSILSMLLSGGQCRLYVW